MPILNTIVENVPKEVLQKCAIFVFIVFCCATQLITNVVNLNGGYSVLWLAILYLLGAYMAKNKTLRNTKIWVDFLGFIVCVIVTVISRIAMGNLFGRGINILVSYTSPTIVLSAVFLVSMFSKLKMRTKSIKIISFLSPMAFGVYLIHCHPYVFNYMADKFVWVASLPLYYALFVVLLIALAIFIFCIIIDYIRLLIFKVCKINKLSNNIARVFTKVTNWITGISMKDIKPKK
jgi:surface polysaccharide O-acyltransferase-like enzyme